jgi:uncharacterized membrane protein YgcG
MTRLRWLLALPAIFLATSGPSMAAEVRDKAGLFSAEAVKKARSELDRIEREYSVPVTIESIPSLGGESIKEVTTRHAESVGARGIYILIPKAEHKIWSEASRGYLKYLTRPRLQAIDEAFIAEFKKSDFDAGLIQGVSRIDSTLAEARTEAGGSLRPAAAGRRAAQAPVPVGRPRAAANNSWGIGSLMMIVIGILGVFLVIRIIGALFSAGRGGYGSQAGMGGPAGYGRGGPGYGAPGYGGGGGGGGGGGFMSSMFGGIGGALAGNWLYDQFSGRHHGSVDQTSYDPASGAAPAPDAAPEWGEGGAGGDWGGGGDAGGGGDWGGSAGGGGDWGGGGGGDWGGGGGGDDGGSW